MTYGATFEEWVTFDLLLGLTRDLLPVVSNPHAEISPDSKMKALGKTPSRYNREGHVVGFPKWTEWTSLPVDLADWSQEPDYGICIQTRRVRALDIDVGDHLPAQQIEDAWYEALGIDCPVRMRSNSGKRLLAFVVEGDLPKRRMTVEGGIIELLATGQQFVAAGEHPSGVRYTWSGGLPHTLPVISLAQLDAAWQALADRFAVEPPTSSSGLRRRGQDLTITDPVVDHLFAHGLVLDTGRDGQVFVECPWSDQHTQDNGLTQTSWMAAGSNGYERGHFSCLHAHCQARTDSEFKAAVGFDENEFEPVVDVAPPKRRRFEAVPIGQFTEGAPLTWFIKGVIPRAALGVIYGQSTAGKSFIALDLAAHIALGREWLGHRVTKARVVYVVAEGVAGSRKRNQALAHALGIDLNDLDVHIVADAPNLLKEDDGKALAAELSLIQADLVIVDTLAQTTPGANENSSEDMGLALRHCKTIHEASGATVLLIHHSGKDIAKGSRGWSGIKGACDFEGEVLRDGDDRLFKVSKNKDSSDGDEYHFKLKIEHLGVDEDLEAVTSCSVEYCAPPQRFEKIEPPKGANELAIWEALRLLSPDGVGVETETVVAAAVARLPEKRDAKGHDRRAENVRRSLKSLISARRIAQCEGEIWLEW